MFTNGMCYACPGYAYTHIWFASWGPMRQLTKENFSWLYIFLSLHENIDIILLHDASLSTIILEIFYDDVKINPKRNVAQWLDRSAPISRQVKVIFKFWIYILRELFCINTSVVFCLKLFTFARLSGIFKERICIRERWRQTLLHSGCRKTNFETINHGLLTAPSLPDIYPLPRNKALPFQL